MEVSATRIQAPDRQALERHVDHYLAALVSGDPSKANLADNVKYSENQQVVAVGDGLWQQAKQLGTYKFYVADTRTAQVVYMGNILTTAGWSMLTLRLRIKDDHITEAETICPGPAAADGTFDLGAGAAEAEHARPLFSADLKTEEKRDRWQLIWAADLHFQGIERGNGDIVPFAESCVKIENGMQLTSNPAFTFPAVSPSGADVPNFAAMACRDQFNTHIWDTDLVTDRRYPVVDEERGIVVAFGMYNQYIRARCADVVDVGVVCPPTNVEPYSLAFAEAFKIQAGMIEAIESIFTVLPQLKTRGVW